MQKENFITTNFQEIIDNDDIIDFFSDTENLIFGKRKLTEIFSSAITIAEELSS